MIRYRLQGSKEKEKFIYALFDKKGIFIKIATGIPVIVKYWDRKKQKVKNVIDVPNRDSINNRLNMIQVNFEREYLEHCYENPTKEKIHKTLREAIQGKETNKITLASFFDIHINNLKRKTNIITGKPITMGTINKFTTLKSNLFEFNSTLNFNDITKDFYVGFTEWLRIEKDLKPNTIGKYISALKEVLSHATEEGVNTNLIYKSKGFKVLLVETNAIYLNEDELDSMYNLDLSNNPPLENARNLFLIGCYTGVRFSDIENIRNKIMDNPSEKNVTIIQEKTGHTVTIPVLKKIREIVKKNLHQITNQRLNQYIKQVGELAKIETQTTTVEIKGDKNEKISTPKYKHITTHTARRSFATNSIKRGIPVKVIMSITGHKKEDTFYKYIRTTGEENANLLRKGWEK